jgi:hypothetical protein
MLLFQYKYAYEIFEHPNMETTVAIGGSFGRKTELNCVLIELVWRAILGSGNNIT